MKSRHSPAGTAAITTAALCGLTVALAGCSTLSHQDAAPTGAAQAKTPPVAVQATRPARRDVSRLISLPGDIHPWQEATLYAKAAGYLERIDVDKGDRVRAGQVLAVIRAPELEADRAQAQQTYASGVEEARSSEAEADRANLATAQARLTAEKAAADYAQGDAVVAKAQAQVQQAEAQAAQAKAQQGEAEAQLSKAQADLVAAQADQQLAEQTSERYRAIYDRDHALIAKQDVDTYESRAAVARSRTAAAQEQVTEARQHGQSMAAQAEAAATQVAAANEQVRIARSQREVLQKQREIAQKGVGISGREADVARSRAAQAHQMAGASAAGMERAAALADYTHIRAPFDGVVTQRSVDPGAFIQTAAATQNAASIVTVAQMNPVRLYVNVPETEAGFVRAGTRAKVTITGMPADAEPLQAKVARTSESLDPKTRTLLAELDMPNPKRTLLPGGYATVKLVQQTHPGVLSVPSPAINKEKSGKSVFVIDGGKVKRVAVTTGFDDGSYTEIIEGLHGDEQVVVTGKDALTPGTPVTVTTWPGTKAPLRQ